MKHHARRLFITGLQNSSAVGSSCDKFRDGRLSTAVNNKNIDVVRRMIKTDKEQSDLSRYKDAYEEVKPRDSLVKAADNHGINHCFLLRCLQKRDASSPYIQRADTEESGFKAPVVDSGLTAQEVVLAMFATIATQIDP
ncbi:hypothetical protein EVAR_102110_1 [Eumeta japonica]|uniref:Uncharacterized protein n=1 Tax=Eumeta variegata TaxID=151549 RepID=A0A4C1TZS2_EUMVA|nr:hypothetical protein EVAR_102110_1 [Eumeta japonica]